MTQESKPIRVFLSYARGDDGEPYDPATSFVNRLYADLTKAGFDVWFDRVSLPSRQLTFHQEIADAIRERDRLILVAGPKAATSDYVRQEWRWALELDKPVIPILRRGDYEHIPGELSLLHCEDFRDDAKYTTRLAKLIDNLHRPAPPLGALLGEPSLPLHFLGRPELLRRVKDALLVDLQKAVVITGEAARVGMQGMGGIGKSVLAAALARDPEVRRCYPDGIVWVSVGQRPDRPGLQRDVARRLGCQEVFETETQGLGVLRQLLLEKAVLLVLDDVWNARDAQAFDVLGPRCRALITTRDAGVIHSLHGQSIPVSLFTEAEAIQLLADAVGVPRAELPPAARELVKECGCLPLAVALCGGMAKKNAGDWSAILKRLRTAALEKIADREAINEQHRSIWRAMQVSVDALEPAQQQRFAELAVFDNDDSVPEAAARTFWAHTDSLDALDTTDLLIELADRSLVQLDQKAAKDGEGVVRRFRLHDLLYDYATRITGEPVPLHNQLLDAYRKLCPDGWPSGPNDGYFHRSLVHHLASAERAKEARALLFNLDWLAARLQATDVNGLIGDYDTLGPIEGEGPSDRNSPMRLVQGSLRLSSHVLARDAAQLAGQLLGRLLGFDDPEIRSLVNQARSPSSRHGRHFLLPTTPSLTPPGGPLLRTLEVHVGPVNCCVVYADGRRALSGSGDKLLKVWDLESGECLRTLEGHGDLIICCAVDADGRQALSGSEDKMLKVWDLESGKCLRTLEGHRFSIECCAVYADGRRALSGSLDTLKVWNLESGECLRTLEGHSGYVSSCAVYSDGRRALSGSRDKTLKVWDLESGACLRTLERRGDWLDKFGDSVHCCAVYADGHRALSGSPRSALTVWDLESGKLLRTFVGHSDSVNCCTVYADGCRALSGSSDNTLKVWDLESGACLRMLDGHGSFIYCSTVYADGRRVLSGSYDNTLKIWDLESGACLRTLEGHGGGVSSCVVYANDRRVLLGSWKKLKVWDLESGECLRTLEGHSDYVSSCAVYSDGRRALSGSRDKTLKVWDLESGACLRTLEGDDNAIEGCIDCCVVYADGRRALLGSREKLKVWDLESGECLRTLEGHRNSVRSCVVYSDGRRALSGSRDKTLKVWDLESGECLATFSSEHPIDCCAATPDGNRIVGGGEYVLLHFLSYVEPREPGRMPGHQGGLV